jgi:hypothetical protein
MINYQEIYLKNKNNLLMILLLSVSTIFLFITLYYCKYGFDLTDEGFYINSFSYPELYNSNITFFGFIYHFLFKLVSENLVLLRQLNILIIYCLSFLFSYIALGHIVPSAYITKTQKIVYSVSVSVSSLFYLTTFNWLITPSYNSLNFIGFLITSIGLINLKNVNSTKFDFNLFFIGFGGYLVFMAKLPSILPLAFFSLVYLICSNKFSFNKISIIVLYFLIAIFLTALLVDHSVYYFIERLERGYANARLLVSASIFRLDMFFWNHEKVKIVMLLISLAFIYNIVLLYRTKIHFKLNLLLFLGFVIFLKLNQKILFNFNQIDFIFFPLFSLATVIIFSILQQKKLLNRNNLVLSAYLFFIPYAYVFGTSNPYWFQSQLVCFFWILSSFCLISELICEKNSINIIFIPILVFMFLDLCMSLYKSLDHPYRQSSFLKMQKNALLNVNKSSKVYVEESFLKCVENIREKIKKKIPAKSFNIIDLTGQSPGLIYLLNGVPVGAPWLLGGYEGSNQFLSNQLENVLKQRNYLLIENRILEPKKVKMLKNIGIDIESNYKEIIVENCKLTGYELPYVQYKIYRQIN